jgi:hypothetical protein
MAWSWRIKIFYFTTVHSVPENRDARVRVRPCFQASFGEKSFLRTVYKPHSVHDACASLGDHLSGRCVAAPLDATYPGLAFSSHEKARMKTSSLPPSADGFVPTWSCSRRGLPGHPHYCRCRWSFTPPFHHHPHLLRGELAVCFCGPRPAG